MSTTAYIVIAVVVVIAVIAIAMIANQRKSSRLQNTFGPEYERTIQQTGDRRQAERELAGRVERRKQFNIVELPEQARQQYLAQWQRVQAAFVDAPAESVRQADALVSQVMTDRGYPVAEFEQRADDVSVDHPRRRRELPQRPCHRPCQRPGPGRYRGPPASDDPIPSAF